MAVSDTVTLAPEAKMDGAFELETRPSDDAVYLLGRRNFTIAVLIGTAVTGLILLWVLWDLWSSSADPFRGAPNDFFYDYQARAMFHGHLNMRNGSLGIEGFLHNGRTYTYFGIFPSILRMPVLLITSRFDGALTAPSLLLAWMMTALFSSLMLWRLRIVTRGRAVLGRAEAASYGVLIAAIMGGSVIIYLNATPFVYNEDFAWSIPLTVGSLFALLGVMERPSAGRVWASGILVLLASINRTPTGYACVIGAGLVGLWFVFGRGGDSNRRWGVAMFAVALVGFAASCAVTYAKFGTPIGLPMAEQVWAKINAHRRYFLAANGGKAFSIGFLPSTLFAYLQPFGIRFSTLFPFVTTPTAPAAALGGAVLDQTYPTASAPATMPLVFLLGCWGVISAFRPRALVPFRLTRIVLLTGAAATAGVLVWGYISERYLADFMPLLIVASGVGLIEIWRRFEGRSIKARGVVLGILCAVAVYSVVVNTAIAAAPSEQFTTSQVQDFVSAEESLSIGSVAASVHHVAALPNWAPFGELYMVGDCSGLYLSSGITEKDVPGLLAEHYSWIPVEQSPAFKRSFSVTFNHPGKYFTKKMTLMTYGSSSVIMEPAGKGYFRLEVLHSGTPIKWPYTNSARKPISVLHEPFQFQVTTDPNLHQIKILWFGTYFISHFIAGSGPPVVHVTPKEPNGRLPEVTVAKQPVDSSLSLCRNLQRGALTGRVATSSRAEGRVRSAVTLPPGRPHSPPSGIPEAHDSRLAQAIFSCVVDEHPRLPP